MFFDWLLSDGQSTIFCVTPSKMRDVTKQQIQMRAFTSMYSHGISYAHRSLRDTSDEPVFCLASVGSACHRAAWVLSMLGQMTTT
jgi:hypothetical protein